MGPFTLVWDWNGTLLDDAQLCVDVMNLMLEKRGLPLLDLERYREVFTFPVADYYQRIGLDFAREPFADLAEEYIVPYNQAALSCGLCQGAEEALGQLHSWGARQIIASASHQDALKAQVESQGIAGYFDALLGVQDSLGGGKAGIAKDYLLACGADFSRVWFVGDTLHDWQVAQEIGCGCALIAQGHQSYARLSSAGAPVLHSLEELPGFLQSAALRPRFCTER